MFIFVRLRKVVAILLILFYGLSSSGMTVQFHYCCGKLKEVKLTSVSPKQCGMKHMAMSRKKCCDDKQVELKLKADQNTQPAAKFAFSTLYLQKPDAVVSEITPIVSKAVVHEIFAPPPRQNPIYIFNCVYRI